MKKFFVIWLAFALFIFVACDGSRVDISSGKTSGDTVSNSEDIHDEEPIETTTSPEQGIADEYIEYYDEEPIEMTTPHEQELADAYMEYYGVLMAAVDEYGVGLNPNPYVSNYEAALEVWLENQDSGMYNGLGVFRAELIYFGDSILPQLLYVYDIGYGPNCYVSQANVYGFSSDTRDVEFYSSGYGTGFLIGGDNEYYDLYLATDRYGVLYLHQYVSNYWYDENDVEFCEVEESYYSVINGRWVEVPEGEIDVQSRRGFRYSPDSVHDVLAELRLLS